MVLLLVHLYVCISLHFPSFALYLYLYMIDGCHTIGMVAALVTVQALPSVRCLVTVSQPTALWLIVNLLYYHHYQYQCHHSIRCLLLHLMMLPLIICMMWSLTVATRFTASPTRPHLLWWCSSSLYMMLHHTLFATSCYMLVCSILTHGQLIYHEHQCESLHFISVSLSCLSIRPYPSIHPYLSPPSINRLSVSSITFVVSTYPTIQLNCLCVGG